MYCGPLPFGATKGDDGIPVPDIEERPIEIDGKECTVRNYDGLRMAFELAAKGKTDREVTMNLNSLGYTITGTHESRPFSKDTVKGILKNRFYIGYIIDGNAGWLKAKHAPLIEPNLFEEVQNLRTRRITSRGAIRSDSSVYSLTGIARCAECGSTLRAFKARGRVRLLCNGRLKRGDGGQPSNFLDIYESYLRMYMAALHIPADYQERILEAQEKLQSMYDVDARRSALEAQLPKLEELYRWGHKTRSEYLADYDAIKRELQQLTPAGRDMLEKLATFLKDMTQAWDQASQEQRNRLVKRLLEAVWIKDKKVLAVTPQPEFNLSSSCNTMESQSISL